MFIPINGVVRVTRHYVLDSEDCQVVFYHVVPYVRVTMFDMNFIASIHTNHWFHDERSRASVDLVLDHIDLEDASQLDGPFLRYTTSLPSAGTYPVACLPNNVSYMIRWITEDGRQVNRGRSSMPGVPLDAIESAGRLKSSFVSTIQAGWVNLIDRAGPSYYMVRVSLFHDNQPRNFGLPSQVIDCQVDNYTNSTRRRLHK